MLHSDNQTKKTSVYVTEQQSGATECSNTEIKRIRLRLPVGMLFIGTVSSRLSLENERTFFDWQPINKTQAENCEATKSQAAHRPEQ